MIGQYRTMLCVILAALLLSAHGKSFKTQAVAILGEKPRYTPFPKKEVAASPHHENELMSPSTAVANVLADLCPHGMLPIGTYCTDTSMTR